MIFKKGWNIVTFQENLSVSTLVEKYQDILQINSFDGKKFIINNKFNSLNDIKANKIYYVKAKNKFYYLSLKNNLDEALINLYLIDTYGDGWDKDVYLVIQNNITKEIQGKYQIKIPDDHKEENEYQQKIEIKLKPGEWNFYMEGDDDYPNDIEFKIDTFKRIKLANKQQVCLLEINENLDKFFEGEEIINDKVDVEKSEYITTTINDKNFRRYLITHFEFEQLEGNKIRIEENKLEKIKDIEISDIYFPVDIEDPVTKHRFHIYKISGKDNGFFECDFSVFKN